MFWGQTECNRSSVLWLGFFKFHIFILSGIYCEDIFLTYIKHLHHSKNQFTFHTHKGSTVVSYVAYNIKHIEVAVN